MRPCAKLGFRDKFGYEIPSSLCINYLGLTAITRPCACPNAYTKRTADGPLLDDPEHDPLFWTNKALPVFITAWRGSTGRCVGG